MINPAYGQMGRLGASWSKQSLTSGLKGSVRRSSPATDNSGTGTIYGSWLNRLKASKGMTATKERLGLTGKVQALTGTIRPVVKESLDDGKPLASNRITKKEDESVAVPAITEKGNSDILASIKSGLTTYMPAILVIGAVVIAMVIIKSAGK